MPSPTYAQNKKCWLKWREANMDKIRQLDARRKRWKYARMEFLAILI